MPHAIDLRELGIVVIVLLSALSTGSQQLEVHPTNTGSGCKTGGQWEPGCYEKLVQTIPTVKGKAEYLARVADTLQTQIQTANLGIQNANRVADTLQSQAQAADLEKKLGIEAVGTYQIAATNVVVNTSIKITALSPWASVFALAGASGAEIEVVPLFETVEDLGRASQVLDGMVEL